jgi:pimeloyl-ACP methyl ester carboxylesterase
MSAIQLCLVLVLTGATTMGCVGPVKHKTTTDYPAAVLYAVGTPPVIDGRARFREIFCRLLAADPEVQASDSACDEFLLRFNDEPLPDENPRPIAKLSTRYRVMVVPGFLNECVAGSALPFEDAIPSLSDRGFKIEALVVGGRSSSDANAAHIAEAINHLDLGEDEKLVLVGHSKGAVDILHCLVNFPQAVRHVAAVVSVAGAINGSPLAAKMKTITNGLVWKWSPAECDTGDDGAINSLRPAIRLNWMAANPLPQSVRYFSLASVTNHDHVNTLLKNGYELLWIYSPRNDGLLLSVDQLVPGGTLLGYANADHWSVALPLENKNYPISETIRAPIKFPRSILLHALLIYVAEALESEQE